MFQPFVMRFLHRVFKPYSRPLFFVCLQPIFLFTLRLLSFPFFRAVSPFRGTSPVLRVVRSWPSLSLPPTHALFGGKFCVFRLFFRFNFVRTLLTPTRQLTSLSFFVGCRRKVTDWAAVFKSVRIASVLSSADCLPSTPQL